MSISQGWPHSILASVVPIEFAHAIERIGEIEFVRAFERSQEVSRESLPVLEGVLESAVVFMSVNEVELEQESYLNVLATHLFVYSISDTDLESCITPLTVGLLTKCLGNISSKTLIQEVLSEVMKSLETRRKVEPTSIYPALMALVLDDEQVSALYCEVAEKWHASDVSYWEKGDCHPLFPLAKETSMYLGISMLANACILAAQCGREHVSKLQHVWEYFENGAI